MIRFTLIPVMVLFLSSFCTAQVIPMPIEKADSLMHKQAKPLMILLSTDWCRYCQMQKSQLRKNKNFIKRTDSFYYVELNAETKESIRFHGQDYHFRENGVSTGIHELAVALNGSERVAFPTWVLLDKNYQVLFRYNGAMTRKQLNELITAID